MNSFWQMHKIFAGLLAKPRPNPQSTMGNWQFLGPTPKKLWIPYNAVDKYGISTIHSTRQTYLQSVSQSVRRTGGQAAGWVGERVSGWPGPYDSRASHPHRGKATQATPTQPSPTEPNSTQRNQQDKLRNGPGTHCRSLLGRTAVREKIVIVIRKFWFHF